MYCTYKQPPAMSPLCRAVMALYTLWETLLCEEHVLLLKCHSTDSVCLPAGPTVPVSLVPAAVWRTSQRQPARAPANPAGSSRIRRPGVTDQCHQPTNPALCGEAPAVAQHGADCNLPPHFSQIQSKPTTHGDKRFPHSRCKFVNCSVGGFP